MRDIIFIKPLNFSPPKRIETSAVNNRHEFIINNGRAERSLDADGWLYGMGERPVTVCVVRTNEKEIYVMTVCAFMESDLSCPVRERMFCTQGN